MENVLCRGYFYVIIGVIAIGFGGVFSTLGWNTINKYSRMKELIIAIAREWEINETILKDDLFNQSKEDILGSRVLYPHFKSNSLNAILSSGVFSSKSSKNRKLLRIVADYEYTITDINSRLAVSNNFIVSTPDNEAIRKHHKYVIESPGFKGFLQEHSNFRRELSENYKWSFSEKFLIETRK